MRRIPPRLTNTMALAVIVISVGVAIVATVGTMRPWYAACWLPIANRAVIAVSERGGLTIVIHQQADIHQTGIAFQDYSAGAWCWWFKYTHVSGWTQFSTPTWILILLAISLSILYRCPWQRYKIGCCRNCGYDLRANEPGTRCPECGTIPPTADG